MTQFVALYRGRTVAEAELLAVSAEERLVRRFFAELLGEPEHWPEDIDREKSKSTLKAARDG